MPQIRPELKKGIAVLSIFLLVMVSTEVFFPYPIQTSDYASISLRKISESSIDFEGRNVSSRATIISITDYESLLIAETLEGPNLSFPSSEAPVQGNRILIRGTSWVSTNNSVSVHEFYVLDYSSSIIRSIPGIILFVVMFFMIFRIDFTGLAFVLRRKKDA